MLLELPQDIAISEPVYRAAVLVRRRKLIGKPKPPKVYVPKPKLRAPADDHVWAYRAYRLQQNPHLTPTDYVRMRSLELRIAPNVMLGPSRKRAVTTQRNRIILELRQRGLSLQQIGLVLHRDHTSILHAIRRVEAGEGDDEAKNWVRRKNRQSLESQHRIRAEKEAAL